MINWLKQQTAKKKNVSVREGALLLFQKMPNHEYHEGHVTNYLLRIHKKMALGSNVSRRLRELREEGLLTSRQHNGVGCMYYKLKA